MLKMCATWTFSHQEWIRLLKKSFRHSYRFTKLKILWGPRVSCKIFDFAGWFSVKLPHPEWGGDLPPKNSVFRRSLNRGGAMSCCSCVYYAEDQKCKLYGSLDSLDNWQDCEEYIYGGTKFVAGPCCGIYNFPDLRPRRNTRRDLVEEKESS